MSTKTYCDKCKAEIPEPTFTVVSGIRMQDKPYPGPYHLILHPGLRAWPGVPPTTSPSITCGKGTPPPATDLCHDCYKEVLDLVGGGGSA